MKKCDKCGEEIDESAIKCPKCKSWQGNLPARRREYFLNLGASSIMLLIWLWTMIALPPNILIYGVEVNSWTVALIFGILVMGLNTTFHHYKLNKEKEAIRNSEGSES